MTNNNIDDTQSLAKEASGQAKTEPKPVKKQRARGSSTVQRNKLPAGASITVHSTARVCVRQLHDKPRLIADKQPSSINEC